MNSKNSSSQIVVRRRKKRQKANRSWQKKMYGLAKVFAILISTVLSLLILWSVDNYSLISKDLPSIENLPRLLDKTLGQLLQPTRIYDRSGEIVLFSLENPNGIDAEYVEFSEMPDYVVDATIALFDPGFWDHSGFYYSMDFQKTTLAQKIAGQILLWQEKPSSVKFFRKTLLAAQMTDEFGQEKVIEWFLNTAYYGHLAYGIDEASQVYFDKATKNLTLAESAMLASIAEAPALNPIDTPEVAIERQGKVLQTMLVQGLISIAEASNANKDPIQIQSEAVPTSEIAPDFIKIVLEQLNKEFGVDRVQLGGLKVISTLDIRLQSETICTIETQLGRLKGDIGLDEIQSNCDTARLLPRIGRNQLSLNSSQNASVVILDSSNGEILALVGDAKEAKAPGTILSPFIYLTAFTLEMSPATLLWDIPSSLPEAIPESNLQAMEFHGPVRLRTALANDYITSAMQTLNLVGPADVWMTAQLSGLKNLEIPSSVDSFKMLLDEGSVNLLELSHAYSMLSNQGTLAGQIPNKNLTDSPEPNAIIQVSDYSDKLLSDKTSPDVQVIVGNQLAYLVTDILSDDLARQSSLGHPNPLETGRPSASKIGKTIDNKNAWTVGYNPQRVVGVWLGNIDSNSGEASPIVAAGLWHAIMKTTYSDLPFSNWIEPLGMNRITVCDPSGLLPTEECPNLVTELFISGNEPVQHDNLYQSILINSQTERLATVYSPAEFVEEQVYLVVPPNASEWAESSGLEIPPNTYDVIFNNTNLSGPAIITSPEIFSYVSGKISIQGSASGDDFSYYRLQIGEGLNPRQWLQIGGNYEEAVVQGELAVWDTKGLNGLFAIQLLLVNKDNSIQTAIVQVSVDNLDPEIQLGTPEINHIYQYPGEKDITIQAQIVDNLGVATVQIFVDNNLISILSDPPYLAPWAGVPGEHEVKIIAIDLAGNQAELIYNFQIEN